MRFPDWGTKVREQQKRLAAIQLGEVRDSICLENRTIKISLSPIKGEVEISGDGLTTKSVECSESANKWSDPRIGLSELFRRHQLEFDEFLSGVTKQVDEVVESFTKLYSMIVERDIPELVMRRIAGEGGSAVGQYQCVQEVGQGRMFKQVDDMAIVLFPTLRYVSRFSWNEEISGKELEVSWDPEDLRVSWGDEIKLVKKWGAIPLTEAISLNQTLLYLANFDAIQHALDKGVRAALAAVAVIQGAISETVDLVTRLEAKRK